ncbi:MAG: YfhO family protein [Bacillota bacterium]|nr:YfhO family protein [Bacillota bacterium]
MSELPEKPDQQQPITPEQPSPDGTAAKKDGPLVAWLRVHAKWLFNDSSLFYFGLALMLLSMFWCGWSLIYNNFTQLYGWDYEHQFLMFYYNYWDIWHEFFQTGTFRLYDYSTFLGVDSIGSNSYYGLFDPFVVIMALFPRAWLPQMTAITTFLKLVVTAFFARAYLRYMGINEWIARLGAIAIAFSGFMNFMVGFQNVVSAIVWMPLILLGIEKVIRERKPSCLVWGLAMLGITNFFYVVPACIWGVIYAGWRFFQTQFKDHRSWKENCWVIGVGVMAFAVGLMLCSWVMLPSVRQSSTSGRTTSIGSAYLSSILNNLKQWDIAGVIGLLFQPVGMNSGRELMALVSFFYPSGGYLYLPLVYGYAGDTGGLSYDSWTASIFCYTIFVVCFFLAVIHSIRKRKWSHLVAIALICYLLFTTFAYYFFFAFSGNGYGRWFCVLIPEIVLYGCYALQERNEHSKWTIPTATVLAFIGTLLTYFITTWVLNNEEAFSNPENITYFISYYVSADRTTIVTTGGTVVVLANRIWYVYYQAALVVAEGAVLFFGRQKPWLSTSLYAFIAVEAVVMGNCSFVYGSSYDYDSFMGGYENYKAAYDISQRIEANDSDFYRTYFDAGDDMKNYATALGLNGTSSFHSLLNFDVMDYAIMQRICAQGGYYTSYDVEQFNYSWSGYYGNKRFGTDATLGVRYYVIKNDGYGEWQGKNVPFGSTYVEEMSNDYYKVYRNDNVPSLGHAVDKNQLYYMQKDENSGENYSEWRALSDWANSESQAKEIMRNDDFMQVGAIIDDDTVLPDGFEVNTGLPMKRTDSRYNQREITSSQYNVALYTTDADEGNLFLSSTYYDEGPAYFLNHADEVAEVTYYTYNGNRTISLPKDEGHLVFSSKNDDGYFNDDPDGAYFTVVYPSSEPIRLYMIGDKGYYDENGNWVIEEENQLLSFEYHAIDGMPSDSVSREGVYGVYADGRVKYIVWETPGNAGTSITFSAYVKYYMQEYHEEYSKYDASSNASFPYGDSYEALSEYLGEEWSLDDVEMVDATTFSFTSDWEEEQFVVTQLAYDTGWKLYANGKEVDTYRANGGFVSFIAPAGEVTYTLKYETTYLKEGFILASVGVFIYTVYMCYDFVKQTKEIEKAKRELGSRVN